MAWNLGLLGAAGAGVAGAYELIETQVLTSNASSVTFSNIPQDYQHLQLRAVVGQNYASYPVQAGRWRINNDTGNNYQIHRLFGNGSSVNSEAADLTYWELAYFASNNNTSIFSPIVMDILDYSSINKNTVVRALNGHYGSSSPHFVGLFSGLHLSTSAMTSITHYFGDPADNISIRTGSRYSLYGIKGA